MRPLVLFLFGWVLCCLPVLICRTSHIDMYVHIVCMCGYWEYMCCYWGGPEGMELQQPQLDLGWIQAGFGNTQHSGIL